MYRKKEEQKNIIGIGLEARFLFVCVKLYTNDQQVAKWNFMIKYNMYHEVKVILK